MSELKRVGARTIGHRRSKMALFIVGCGVLSMASGSFLHASPPVFTNQTMAAGISANHLPTYLDSFVAGGAVGDFNNDGWQDFYFATGGGQADQLYINNGDGTFTNRASEWGIVGNHQGTGAAVADYDNDGWEDIFVSSFNNNRLYRNSGNGSFTNVASTAGVTNPAPYGGAFGDYDLDGDLDLAVVNWGNSSSNRLYRNNGDGTFSNVSGTSGITASTSGINGFTVRFCDMDGDRYPELLWVGDFGTTRYLRNNGNGTFSNVTNAANVAWDGTEMGHTVQDFDRDGLFDWYITTINTNNLYRNLGGHSYQQIGDAAGVAFTGWGWGTVGVDFNHDMKFDIAATSQGTGQFMFMNNSNLPGSLQFSPINAGFQSGVSGRGLANFDYDRDGDQDLLLFPRQGSVQLFRNDLTGSDTNWIRIVLETSSEADIPPHGVGAVLRVTAGGVTQMGRLDAGSNYQSQSELAAHFGLETASIIDTLVVEWPNGTSTVLTDVAVNQHLTISAGSLGSQFVRGDINDDGSVNVSDAITGLNHIFMGQAIECQQAVDANADGNIDISDVIVLVAHLFTGGGALPAPFPSCGDGDLQGLDCDVFSNCP